MNPWVHFAVRNVIGPMLILAWAVVSTRARGAEAEESGTATATAIATASASVDFNRDIRPILSQNCFFCHGPDERERKGGRKGAGGLRLDTLAGQREDLGGRAAVVPGRPDDSVLVQRVETADGDDAMPPRSSGKRITPREAELLRRWITSGARYSNHWAYEGPVRPALPPVREAAWVRNGVDRFVLARLEREGLRPQPEADRRVLARRVALDLTGLPPDVDEVEALVADPRPDAFERYVDACLAKAAYGEHWARMWLDLARYADSAGYADDPPRTIWPYRDYVIRAFNENLPFDRFTIEQLAGDLLPEPTEAQLQATAFHRNTLTNSEGGTSDEEFRNVAVVDRVNTTFAVWMGTSMACAQCHSHKYDPISQREYFQLFAFFNNTADADRPDEAPLFEFDSPELRETRDRLTAELGRLDAEFQAARPNLAAAAVAWARSLAVPPAWTTPRPAVVRAESGAELRVEDDLGIRVQPKGTNAAKDTYTIELPFDRAAVLTGLRIEALADPALEQGGPGLAGNFLVRQVKARVLPVPNQAGPVARFVRIESARAGVLALAEVQAFSQGENVASGGEARQSSTRGSAEARVAIDGRTEGTATDGSVAATTGTEAPWWEVDLKSARPVERVVVWPVGESASDREGWRVVLLDGDRRVVGEKTGVVATGKSATADFLGPRPVVFANASADHNATNLDEALVATDAPRSGRHRVRSERGWSAGGQVGRDHALWLATAGAVEIPRGATLEVTVVQQGAAAGEVLGRLRVSATDDGRVAEQVDMPPSVRSVVGASVERWTTEERERVEDYFVRWVAPGLREPRARFERLSRERDALKPLSVPVFRELAGKDRRVTRVQIRGNYLQTAEEVTAGVPAAWPPLPEGAPRNRLGLAQWLVSPENPLTARVLVNRLWEQIFGHGIVRTSEEFGSQGEAPVNQELLDWLACEMRARGWDVKAFLRLLVTSAAYRQSSKLTPAAREMDPDNRWVSRGPRFRLGAELVRDQALASAGLLSGKMHGPSVRPPRPNLDLRAAFGGNLDWQASPGEDGYRRGVYTEWRRSSPYPSMATFDAPSREVCMLRRNRSNTPLQALVTLNDPVYVEAAAGLARRMVEAGADAGARIEQGYRVVLARRPSATERSELEGLVTEVSAVFGREPERARKLVRAAGEPRVAGVPPEELAAWTAVANVLLNLDETLMKH